MKLSDLTVIFEEQDDIEIISFDVDDTGVSGTHKIDTIKANYHDLVTIFGEPQSYVNDDSADVNFLWDITINYRDTDEEYDGDSDVAFVTIYDYRYNDQDRDPTTIEEWTIGGRNWMDGYVLRTLLNQKGIIA